MLKKLLKAQEEAKDDSVSTSSAQTNKLLQVNNDSNNEYSKIISKVLGNQYLSVDFKFLIWIMLHTGCRVSEALHINSNDVNENWFVKITGSKGSHSRIKLIPPFPLFYPKLQIDNILLFQGISRFYVYRQLKDMGIYKKFNNNKNQSVTHYFRHIYAENLKSVDKNNDASSREIGHRSRKNISYYGN